MARPKSDGLLYFSFDTDFFFSDRRIKSLRARYGSDGIVFYIYLLTEIYRNGYFIRWDEDSMDNAIADLGLTEGSIKQILEYLVSRSLLSQSILTNSVTTITSPGIQKRYQEAVKSLKRDVYVDKEIWLLEDDETATFIKFNHSMDKSEKNTSKSWKNSSKSEKNPTNEIKGNEKTINKDNCHFVPPTPDEIKAYCVERKNQVDSDKFFDFYQSKGWMVGKNKMKDWMAAVRTWEKTEIKTGIKVAFSNQQNYDFKELEDMLTK